MFLAACVDAGVPPEPLQELPRQLGLDTVEVRFVEDRRGGLRGLRCEVLEQGRPAEHSSAAHPHGESAPGLAEVARRIETSGLPSSVRERALSMFTRLAGVEASVHGVPVEQVHFHEVGAADSLVDVVGSALAWSLLGTTTASVADVVVGSGRVKTQHGVMPVPAPATSAMLHGKRCVWEGAGELLTPTGALILESMFSDWGQHPRTSYPHGLLRATGVGLGQRELDDRCNGCRLMVFALPEQGGKGSTSGALADETVEVVQTQIDDVSPEQLAYAVETLWSEAGVLDVLLQPAHMKKGRLGTLVTVICEPGSARSTSSRLVRETGTLGCRVAQSRRLVADREIVEVQTDYGKVRVKVGRIGSEVISVAPEADDCREAARTGKVGWQEVYAAAQASARARLKADTNRE